MIDFALHLELLSVNKSYSTNLQLCQIQAYTELPILPGVFAVQVFHSEGSSNTPWSKRAWKARVPAAALHQAAGASRLAGF